MDRLLLARHGESAYSSRGLVNGDPSRRVPLTARGRREAIRLGEAVAGVKIDLCAISSFPRTRETAEIALAGRNVAISEISDLDDPRAGDFEGRPLEAYRAWFIENGPAAPVPGGGESRVETVERYARAIRVLLACQEPEILVVTHGLPVAYALLAARGEDLPLSLEGFQVAHASVHRLAAEQVDAAAQALEAWVGARRAA